MRDDVLYVLRLWRDADRDNCWRASLENIRTGDRRNFSSRSALSKFIRLQPGDDDEPDES